MPDTRAKFRKLTEVFDPIYRPYKDAGDGPGSSYVPEAHEAYRRQLEGTLDLNVNAKLLVAGQSGCGKTTLLQSVGQKLRRDGRIAAVIDLEAQTAVQDLGLVEMHLAALAELLLQAKAASVALSADTLEACSRWLSGVQGGAGPGVDPEAIAAALRRQLSAVQDSKTLRDAQRDQVKQGVSDDPHDLLLRLLVDLERAELRPVVILDGLDKVPPDRARETFLTDEKKPMAAMPGTAILTLPLSIVYEPTFNVLGERYINADSAVLPAVRPWELDTATRALTPSAPGRAVLRQIVTARVDLVDPSIVLPEAVDRAIVGSGGNIRQLARLIQASVVKAAVREGSFIELQDIEATIADQRESFRRGFQSRFLPVLKEVRDQHRIGDDAGDVAKLLLYGLWVTEYRNGYVWYNLPVPVEQLLDHLERTRS
jgi:energy-coupling factor transporter ATP-binding protein EcfA2